MPKRPPVFSVLSEDQRARIAKQEQQTRDRQRGTSTQRGYDSRWRKARLAFLKKYPLCRKCHSMGVITSATVVDHIIPHKGDKVLFWQRSNWQPLCKPCHDRKTATEDSDFARRGRGG